MLELYCQIYCTLWLFHTNKNSVSLFCLHTLVDDSVFFGCTGDVSIRGNTEVAGRLSENENTQVTLSTHTHTHTLHHWAEITSLQSPRAQQCCHGYTYSSDSQFQAQRTPTDYQSQNPEQTHAEGGTKNIL